MLKVLKSSKSSVYNLSVAGLFNNTKRRTQIHGHWSYTDVPFDSLQTYSYQQLGLHQASLCSFESVLKILKRSRKIPLLIFFPHRNTDLDLWLWILLIFDSLNLHKPKPKILPMHLIFPTCSMPTRESMQLKHVI